MPIKTKQKTILGYCGDDEDGVAIEGDVLYRGTNLPADKANAIATRMGRIFAPTIGKVLNGAKSLTDIMAGDLDKIDLDFGEIASALMTRLDETVIKTLIADLMSGPIVRFGPTPGGKPVKQDLSQRAVFNDVFAANQMELLRVIRFGLEINFPRFLSEDRIGKVLERGQAMMAKASQTSSGSESQPESETS